MRTLGVEGILTILWIYPMDLTILWFRNPYYPMDCKFLGYLEVGCFRVECGHPRETLADIFWVGQSHVSNGCQ